MIDEVIDWVRVKEALHNLADDSGASIGYAAGVVVATAAFMVGLRFDWRTVWQKLIPMLPDTLRPTAIPLTWLNKDAIKWSIPFVNITKFSAIVKDIPKDVLSMKYNDGYSLTDWTVRDCLLDKYLYVLSVLQREYDRVFDEWMADDQPQENGAVKPRPEIVCVVTPVRKSGSQYIIEWSVSDMRKPIENSFNWHGQNTSRWLYAGAICVSNGRVSVHT